MRRLRLALTIYVFVWFNIVVPVHTRGFITIPSGRAQSSANSCCSGCCETDRSPAHRNPTPDQRRRCAVCYVAATYVPLLITTINLAPRERVHQPPAQVLPVLCSAGSPLILHIRAPPACA